ncbi:uncharacterized protein BDV17DRAFT_295267 [Aspergillus undulatus]|uniref:uncharacterized protein n=1 Tax=Aspergillus undulatus TaxID=1810928 RepID=UPI003CCD008C
METAKVRNTSAFPQNSPAADWLHHRTPPTTFAGSVQGTGAEASKETNKQVAKDDDSKLSTRASAAKDAVIDKKDEESHNTKADVHKAESIALKLLGIDRDTPDHV